MRFQPDAPRWCTNPVSLLQPLFKYELWWNSFSDGLWGVGRRMIIKGGLHCGGWSLVIRRPASQLRWRKKKGMELTLQYENQDQQPTLPNRCTPRLSQFIASGSVWVNNPWLIFPWLWVHKRAEYQPASHFFCHQLFKVQTFLPGSLAGPSDSFNTLSLQSYFPSQYFLYGHFYPCRSFIKFYGS